MNHQEEMLERDRVRNEITYYQWQPELLGIEGLEIENGILFVHHPIDNTNNSFLDIKTGSILRSKRETEEKGIFKYHTLLGLYVHLWLSAKLLTHSKGDFDQTQWLLTLT